MPDPLHTIGRTRRVVPCSTPAGSGGAPPDPPAPGSGGDSAGHPDLVVLGTRPSGVVIANDQSQFGPPFGTGLLETGAIPAGARRTASVAFTTDASGLPVATDPLLTGDSTYLTLVVATTAPSGLPVPQDVFMAARLSATTLGVDWADNATDGQTAAPVAATLSPLTQYWMGVEFVTGVSIAAKLFAADPGFDLTGAAAIFSVSLALAGHVSTALNAVLFGSLPLFQQTPTTTTVRYLRWSPASA